MGVNATGSVRKRRISRAAKPNLNSTMVRSVVGTEGMTTVGGLWPGEDGCSRMNVPYGTCRVVIIIVNDRELWPRGHRNTRELLAIGSLASVMGGGEEERYICARVLEPKESQSYAIRCECHHGWRWRAKLTIDLRHGEEFNKYWLVRCGWSGGNE